MAFWGVYVKPGRPYIHSNVRGRLRLSQAALGSGTSSEKSLVRCSIGDETSVVLCALVPDKTDSLQLDLEFEEFEDVKFSVFGTRGVFLSGYYVGSNRLSNTQDDTESYGVDIAISETKDSGYFSAENDYDYDDSFINDDESESLPPFPISSSKDDYKKQKKNEICAQRRLEKYIYIESDDEMDDESEFVISPLVKKLLARDPNNKADEHDEPEGGSEVKTKKKREGNTKKGDVNKGDNEIALSCFMHRAGDKEVMEGLNVGVDGMQVGDKTILIIPPSISNGYRRSVYEVKLLARY